MDFLVLFLLYLALVLLGFVMICIGSKTHYLQGLISRGAQIFSYIIPECLQRAMLRVLHYLFHKETTPSLSCISSCKGWFLLNTPGKYLASVNSWSSLCYLFLPYLLLIVNLFFFALSCVTNPGTITKANKLLFLQVYEFNEVMFPKNVRCPTCDLRKPARSKRCSVCNRCVHRFDHHCVAVFLVRLVVMSDVSLQTYVDDFGHLQVVDTVFLVQYLFLTFPRIVFLMGFVVVLSFLLGGYLCFCLYLAATNQTANEWYKGDRAWCQHCPHMARPPAAEPQAYRNIHSHGLWSNLHEIFLPATARYERKKK
uniref:Palmitoyltransferase n=1 Tax=Moschus moschiferus TaxID=68415 RepID=A0A8C6CKI3_MOSMO